jgi:hypothetical protein
MSGAGSEIANAFGLKPQGKKVLITEIDPSAPSADETQADLRPSTQSNFLGGGSQEDDSDSAEAATKPMISIMSSTTENTKPSLISEMPVHTEARPSRMLISEAGEESLPDFSPAEVFAGQRTGFVFQNGLKGTGYYRDGPKDDAPLESAPKPTAVEIAKAMPEPGKVDNHPLAPSGAQVTERDSDGTRCSVCGCSCTTKKLLRCSGCKINWYCGPSCQRAAWPRHRGHCLRARGIADTRPKVQPGVTPEVPKKKFSNIDDMKICFKCGGLGQYTDNIDIMSGLHGDRFSGLQRVITGECPDCEGDGYVHKDTLPAEAGGTGVNVTEGSTKTYEDYKNSLSAEKRAEMEKQIADAKAL